jgi:archaemetzincin
VRRALALGLLLCSTAGATAAEKDRVVALVPVGKVDPALLQVAARAIEARIAAKVRLEPERALPKEAWNAARQRWRAEKVITALQADSPEGAFKVVGFTCADISTAQGTVPDARVAGLSDVGGRTCVVSSWTAEQSGRTREILHRDIADLVVHELGHALGLAHCETTGCVMRDAKGKVAEPPQPGERRFCEKCRKALGEGVLRPAK